MEPYGKCTGFNEVTELLLRRKNIPVQILPGYAYKINLYVVGIALSLKPGFNVKGA
ncbi:hypothetical protein ES703_23402 [subsurface metagenome]